MSTISQEGVEDEASLDQVVSGKLASLDGSGRDGAGAEGYFSGFRVPVRYIQNAGVIQVREHGKSVSDVEHAAGNY